MRNILSSILMLVAAGTTFAAAEELHRLGLVWKDPRTTAPSHQVRIPRSKDALPVSVDHSANMPPVGNQASQGSCTAWAAAYYHKSYQEWVEHGWSLADQDHQFSPAFVYNQINGGGDYGSWFGDAFQLLCDMGGSSMALTPYNDADCISWPKEAAYDSAIAYRSQDWFWFDLYDGTGIEGVKQCLNDGDNVVIGLLVYANYDNISSYGNIFCVSDLSGDIRGGHANCIVGYNDSLLTNDGYGAFRVVNSWGASWGDNGYYWMSYQAAIDSRTSYQAAFYSSDRIGYQPSLKLRARINHQNRGSVRIKTGVGPTSAPYWEREFFVNSYDGYPFGGGDNPFPDNNIVLDISEGAASIDTAGGNNIFLMTQDVETEGVSGSVEFLGAENTGWGVGNSSLETPTSISDDYGLCYTSLSLHYKDYTISLWPADRIIEQGDTSRHAIDLKSWNGYSHQVALSYQLSPAPVSGSIGLVFDRDELYPTDSCTATIAVSPDVTPGRYSIVVTGTDSIDTLIHSAGLTLWVLGSGEALCIGSPSGMLDLVRTRWSKVDSLALMPPVIGDNYQALILGLGLSPSDTSKISDFIGSGGVALSVGNSVYSLSGGSNLLPVSQWLGASGYALYTGSGVNVISDYQNPFGVTDIDYGDTLGMLTAYNGRLNSPLPGAVPLAHLGTVSSAIAALYNQYGCGKSLWVTAGAGFSQKMDSLIAGYFRNPATGAYGGDDRGQPVGTAKLSLSVYPAPVKTNGTISLSLSGKSRVTLRIYDICGRLVKNVFEGEQAEGRCVFTWNGREEKGREVSSGIYIIKAETEYGRALEKIISVR